MNPLQVPTLVLRAPHGPAVAHLIVEIPQRRGREAAGLLKKLTPSFGPQGEDEPCCSIGFSFAGLEALGVPESYLRLIRRLAPAFAEGAVQRSVRLGDAGLSAARSWYPAFRQDQAHVLVSWHGAAQSVHDQAQGLAQTWKSAFGLLLPDPFKGERLGAPDPKSSQQWVHFGYRDGISEICIDQALPRPLAEDCRDHAPGALLLGHVNNAGFNPFALSKAPEKVRAFFHDSSFGILRPMAQDLKAFEAQLDPWVKKLSQVSGTVTRDYVKAKLCGRWPSGEQMRPDDRTPQGPLKLELSRDPAGEGCPYGSHVRRMRAAPDRNGHVFERPLQRRSLPFGPAAWSDCPNDGKPRGLLGHFFCASIEDQFEHLLGQWAARPPLGFAPEDRALDPLVGPHQHATAALAVPLKSHPTQYLDGFRAWTTTLGTMYAWHPSQSALEALWEDDFVRKEDAGPWV